MITIFAESSKKLYLRRLHRSFQWTQTTVHPFFHRQTSLTGGMLFSSLLPSIVYRNRIVASWIEAGRMYDRKDFVMFFWWYTATTELLFNWLICCFILGHEFIVWRGCCNGIIIVVIIIPNRFTSTNFVSRLTNFSVDSLRIGWICVGLAFSGEIHAVPARRL